LDERIRRAWLEAVREAKADDLPAYQRQMSILGYLDPKKRYELRTSIPLERAHIGVIFKGRYYLIPACEAKSRKPASVDTVRGQIATILKRPSDAPPAQLTEIGRIQRAKLAELYDALPDEFVHEICTLRFAPIIINFDRSDRRRNLADLRQTERGVGDHALTIFDTGETFVFDQSHIFFDGAWGSAFAEILTHEAISWGAYLSQQSAPKPVKSRPFSPAFRMTRDMRQRIQQAPKITPEASAETDLVDLKRLLALRRLFKRRSDLLQLTVNDLLVLFRAIHAATYEPDASLVDALQRLTTDSAARDAAQAALSTLDDRTNPAILIPVDASQRSPTDRLYPMSFEVPLGDLNLIGLHEDVMLALYRYERGEGDRSTDYQRFDELQREYLATLAGFGAILSKAKDIAIRGESASVGSIKLLAHMPTSLQRLLDHIPGRFDILNDIIKGREVFSNVGVVASSSTLRRFITAKDDNDKKTLAWGVITDAEGTMRISLRDFRPHVGKLSAAGYGDLAGLMTQDYLDSYGRGLNSYVRDLQRITAASRETRMLRGEFEYGA
jgi:hypothetical protein